MLHNQQPSVFPKTFTKNQQVPTSFSRESPQGGTTFKNSLKTMTCFITHVEIGYSAMA